MIRHLPRAALIACATAAPAMAPVQTPRDLLLYASFSDHSRQDALARIDTALTASRNELARAPGDREAALTQGMALGYRAKLTGSRADAVAARKQFEALVARDPRNAEAQLALGAWHLGGVYKLGKFVAGATIGAHRSAGMAALDRAVALGGNHALFPGLSALLLLENDPADPTGRALVETASRAGVGNAADRQMQRSAALVLTQIHAGNMAETKALASRLLPFGWLDVG